MARVRGVRLGPGVLVGLVVGMMELIMEMGLGLAVRLGGSRFTMLGMMTIMRNLLDVGVFILTQMDR